MMLNLSLLVVVILAFQIFGLSRPLPHLGNHRAGFGEPRSSPPKPAPRWLTLLIARLDGTQVPTPPYRQMAYGEERHPRLAVK
jgi:hypothetical protein